MGKINTIIQEINSNLPDNNIQSITAKKLRDTLIDTIYNVNDAYDITINTDLKFTSFENAIGTDASNVPEAVRKPGMTIKFYNETTGVYEEWKYQLINTATNLFSNKQYWQAVPSYAYLPSGSLRDVTTSGTYLLLDSQTYEEYPEDYVGAAWFRVTTLKNSWIIQEFMSFWHGSYYIRCFQRGGTKVYGWWRTGGERTTLASTDLNNVKENGTWLLVDSNSYQHMPADKTSGFLRVSVTPNGTGSTYKEWILQEFFGLTTNEYWKRTFRSDVSAGSALGPGEWKAIGTGNTYINNNTFNNVDQNVNLTATPTITTDRNNYLASTNDTTDRTAEILAMLTATGTCHLGPGIFYVDSLVMPNWSSLIGSGAATRIYLKSGENKFAIKMTRYNIIKDLAIWGAPSEISVTSTVGTRHAIMWSGNYTQTQDSWQQPMYGEISNVYIFYFTGGGITCYDTGGVTRNHLMATDVNIIDCTAGINISYNSEYHKFNSVRCRDCYYGCINNGGNNNFVNCDFSASTAIGFLIDNSTGQSPNNSHGSAVGCMFNHIASNTGVAIKVIGANNGYVFTGCQIFFGKVQIENSYGIEITSTDFGKVNCDISVKGGGVTLFANNMHQDTPPSITITNNNTVHFVNCYSRTTGGLITP